MNVDEALAPITPPSWDRCEALVRTFTEYFPQAPIARCEHALAAALFYPSWENLRRAVRDGLTGDPRDEDLAPAARQARQAAQIDALCRVLNAMPGQAPLSELEQRGLRLLVEEVLAEFSPSAEHEARAEHTQLSAPCMTVSSTQWLATFPRALGTWWVVHEPPHAAVGEYLQTQHLDPFSASSIVSFSRLWGAVCSQYGSTLPAGMLLGTAYVLAEHYALTHLRREDQFRQAVAEACAAQDPEGRSAYLLPYCPDQRQWTQVFLEAYPRDDLADLYAQRADLFLLSAYDAIEALGGQAQLPVDLAVH